MTIVRKLEENITGRDLVVGDLHGEYHQLMEALDGVSFDDTNDRLIAVGDLIDRGQDSPRCLELLAEPWFHSIQGNHEDLMLQGLAAGPGSSARDLWFINGGDWARQQDPEWLQIMAREVANRMPLALEVRAGGRRFGIVHADVPRDDWALMDDPDGARRTRDYMLWSRDHILRAIQNPLYNPPPVRNIDGVFIGHTPIRRRARLGNRFYIDTGAVYPGGHLTLVNLSTLSLDDFADRPAPLR